MKFSSCIMGLCCLAFSFIHPLYAQDLSWKWVHPYPEGAEPMYDLHMPDAQTIVAVGRNGYVLRSADAGLNWTLLRAADKNLYSIDFADAQHGWACGAEGTIVKTNDGGLTWAAQTAPAGIFNFQDIDFADAQNGWLSGPGVILKTSNGGSTWQNVSPQTFFSANGIHFINALEGWFCGNTGRIMHTTDGGNNWTDQTSNTFNSLSDIRFLNNQTGWACGGAGTILKTTNGGTTWSVQPSGTGSTSFRSIAISDASTVYAAGDNAALYKTGNGGSSWTRIYPFQYNMDFYSIRTFNNKLLFALAPPESSFGTGKLGISEDGGLTWNLNTRMLTTGNTEFRDVIMQSPQNWWAIGYANDTGYVLKTTNAGQNWSKKTFGRGLYAGAFFNSQIGWVAGSGNHIYKTTDGGNTWTSQDPGNVSADYYDIQVLNDQTLWLAGYNDDDEGVVIKSTDGGQTWIHTNGISGNAINAIHFIDDQKGWAVGNENIVRKTANGGQTWSADTIEGFNGDFSSVFFTSSGTGYICGYAGRLLKTTDGGQNWEYGGLGGNKGNYLNQVVFVHPDTGFAVRNDGKIFKTNNAATTWESVSISPSREIFSISMLNSRQGMIGGNQASLLSTIGGNLTATTQILGEEMGLFPNPVVNTLEINFKGNILEKSLFDLSGRSVPIRPSGSYQLDLSNLPAGIYLLKLKTENSVMVRRVVKQ